MFTLIVSLVAIIGTATRWNNLLIVFMCVEIILLCANLNFIFFSNYLDDMVGQIFAIIVLAVAAAESAIGLAILIAGFRVRGSIEYKKYNLLKG